MKTIRLTTAQALVRFLANQYVARDCVEQRFVHGVLGIFGHGNLGGIGEALAHSDDMPFIQGYSEQGLVHMATAFAKQKRRIGIYACTSSIGPGALNMVTGAATATINRLPVLLLPGDVFALRQPDPVLQQLEYAGDHSVTANDCFKPVSKYWDRINRPEQLMTACLNAMRVLTDPSETGAVTLCLPQDVQAEAYNYPVSFFDKRVHDVERRAPSTSALLRAAEIMKKAKRPLIVCGGGVLYSEAEQVLLDFVNASQIPVAETQGGKGAMPANHPLNVGALGVLGSATANRLAATADVVLAIGTRLGDFTTASKSVFKNAEMRLIHLNVNRMDAGKMGGVELLADAREGILGLTQNACASSASYQSEIEVLRVEWNDEVDRVCAPRSDGTLSQTSVLRVLNDFVGASDVVVAASGSLPGDLMRLWRAGDSRSFHLEYGFSCMGYEVAGALGAKLASPNAEVYAIVGDGAFLMMNTDLLTSLQEQKKITVVLFNNKGYGCIRNLQHALGSKTFGNEFQVDVDFAAYANAMGAQAFHVRELDQLVPALRAAKASPISTLIQVDVAEYSMSHGYDTWWRVDAAQVSECPKVVEASEKNLRGLAEARPY